MLVLPQLVPHASSCSLLTRRPPRSTLFPYTTPFRSYPVAAVNDNERAGINWANGGGGWASSGGPPAWVRFDVNTSEPQSQAEVDCLQENLINPIEPTDTLTFTQYGITDFTVQGWNGS